MDGLANMTPRGQVTQLQLRHEFEALATSVGSREDWRVIEKVYQRGASDATRIAALEAQKFLASLDPLGERTDA